MSIKIYFSIFQTRFFFIDDIDPIDCPITTTFTELYAYISQITNGQYDSMLSFDQANYLPNDATPLSSILPEGGEAFLCVYLIPFLIVNVFLDGQQISKTPIQETMEIGDVRIMISQFVQQLLQSIEEYTPIVDYQISDEHGNLIIKSPDLILTAPFSDYRKGPGQIILNLVRDDPLELELELENMSLILDPYRQLVTYNFHRPLKISGKLRKQQGKPKDKIDKIDFDQLVWNSYKILQYASPDKFGLVVKWVNDTYSVIQIIQKK